jgi:hypothetical protein
MIHLLHKTTYKYITLFTAQALLYISAFETTTQDQTGIRCEFEFYIS